MTTECANNPDTAWMPSEGIKPTPCENCLHCRVVAATQQVWTDEWKRLAHDRPYRNAAGIYLKMDKAQT